MRYIFLVGPRACGKTTIGRELARAAHWPLLDTDALLYERCGAPVSDIVAIEGWEGFRRRETGVLRSVVDDKGAGTCVVSTGGGIVLAAENRAMLREHGVVVYLHVPEAELVRRLTNSPLLSQRPSLTGRNVAEEAAEVARQRDPIYRETAHHVVEAHRSVDEIVTEIRHLVSKQTSNFK